MDFEALGWTEGRNIQVDYRFARGDAALARAHADELVSLALELIVGLSTPVTAALKQATRTIPIIFAIVTDPVGQGLIVSLARPGRQRYGLHVHRLRHGGKMAGDAQRDGAQRRAGSGPV
jgi:ABC-type uncharacterized transport system substrate-binding protein